MNEATLEMTLGLKDGMKEDETMSSEAAAVRNLRRRHSEIGEKENSDDPEYFNKRETNITSKKRSKEVMESLL